MATMNVTVKSITIQIIVWQLIISLVLHLEFLHILINKLVFNFTYCLFLVSNLEVYYDCLMNRLQSQTTYVKIASLTVDV